MTIAFLNPTGEIGGAEQVLIDVLRGVRESRPNWRLHLVAGAPGPLLDRVASLGVPLHLVPLPAQITRLGDSAARRPAGRQIGQGRLLSGMALGAANVPWYVVRMRRILAEIGPDLIHTNGLKMHMIGCWARTAGTPVVWHIHDYVSSRPLMAPLLKQSAAGCAGACAISMSVLRDLHSLCGGSLNIWPVHNGVDLDEFTVAGPAADLDSLADLPPAPPNVVRVGLVATMALWKGHRVFLRAISQLPRELPVRAYVIGGPIYRTQGSQETLNGLRDFAAELGISDRVGFTGLVSEPPAAMRALDIVVHASTEPEPFGLVIAQGMACGRAVIATRNAGAAEMIRFGEDALDHVPGDVAGLASRIRELAEDADRRERLGQHARQTAMMWFNRSRMASEMIRLYREIVPTKVSPGATVDRCVEVQA
jgi:glycosyltransferase involved in cell wall biosynthesis